MWAAHGYKVKHLVNADFYNVYFIHTDKLISSEIKVDDYKPYSLECEIFQGSQQLTATTKDSESKLQAINFLYF